MLYLHCLTLQWNGNIYLLEDLKIYYQENVMYVDSRCCRPVTTTVCECSEEVGSACSDMSGQSAMSAPGKSTNYLLSQQHIIGSIYTHTYVMHVRNTHILYVHTRIHIHTHPHIHMDLYMRTSNSFQHYDTFIHTYVHKYIHNSM